MARKGWDQLSEAYRNRLVRNGITRTDYDQGASLGKARGHGTPTGISERKWESLLRLAYRSEWNLERNVTWDRPHIKAALENELGKGIAPTELEQALRDKQAMQRAYRGGNKDAARSIWLRRNPLYAREIYWYHTK